jgi:hypothetical protein
MKRFRVASVVFTLALAGSPAWAGGWYLMLPPVAHDERGRPYFDEGAPLGEWQHMGAYDSAAQCEEVKLSQRVGVKGKWVNVPNANGYKRCIATDDPRLTVDPRRPRGK